MVTALQLRTAQKSGKRWAMFQLEDFSGQAKCLLWSEQYDAYRHEVTDDKILLFEGKVEWRDGSTAGDVIVQKVITIEQARREMTRGLLLRLPLGDDDETLGKVDGIRSILMRARGNRPVYLSVRDPQGKGIQFKTGDDYSIDPAKVPVEQLELLLGTGAVVFTR